MRLDEPLVRAATSRAVPARLPLGVAAAAGLLAVAISGLWPSAGVATSRSSSAGGESRATVRVRPATVHAGGHVRVSGSVGRYRGRLDCPAGDQVDLLSRAFTAGARDFAGVPTVHAKVAGDGTFSARAAIPAARRPGAYTVSGRCGGGNLGVAAKLRVLRAI